MYTRIQVDPRAALGALTEAQERKMPYAVSLALNRTANDAQATMQAHLQSAFNLRRKQWNLRGIKISKQDRANKTTWRVIIQVAPETSYLNKFEQGGFKIPAGQNYLWEPNEKVFKGKILPAGDQLRPKNLHLHRDPHGRIIGDQRTFLARTGNSEVPMVVVQRVDRGLTKGSKRKLKGLNLDNFGKRGKSIQRTGGTVTLYKLRKRIPIKAILEFVPTIEKSVAATFPMHMGQAIIEAMRPKGGK